MSVRTQHTYKVDARSPSPSWAVLRRRTTTAPVSPLHLTDDRPPRWAAPLLILPSAPLPPPSYPCPRPNSKGAVGTPWPPAPLRRLRTRWSRPRTRRARALWATAMAGPGRRAVAPNHHSRPPAHAAPRHCGLGPEPRPSAGFHFFFSFRFN
jgi:hypothetical protein